LTIACRVSCQVADVFSLITDKANMVLDSTIHRK
jgi:hypothetical protein